MNNFRNNNLFYQNQYGGQQNYTNFNKPQHGSQQNYTNYNKPQQFNSYKPFQPSQMYQNQMSPNQMNFLKMNPLNKRMNKHVYRSTSQNFPMNFSQNQQNFSSNMFSKPQFNPQQFNKPFSEMNAQNFNKSNHFNPNFKFPQKSSNYFDMYNNQKKSFQMNAPKNFNNAIPNTFANNFNSFKNGPPNRSKPGSQSIQEYLFKTSPKPQKLNRVKKMKNRSSKSNPRYYSQYVDMSKQRPFSGNFTQNNKSVDSTFANSCCKTDLGMCKRKSKTTNTSNIETNDLTQETGYQLAQQQQYLCAVNNQINCITSTQNCLNKVQNCMYDALNMYYSNPTFPPICFKPTPVKKKRSSKYTDSSFTNSASSNSFPSCPPPIFCGPPPCTPFNPCMPCFPVPSSGTSFNKSNSCNPQTYSDQSQTSYSCMGSNNDCAVQQQCNANAFPNAYDSDAEDDSMRNLKKKYKKASQELNRVRKKLVEKMSEDTCGTPRSKKKKQTPSYGEVPTKVFGPGHLGGAYNSYGM